MVEIIILYRAFIVSATTLIFWQAAILPVSVENKGNVNIDNHDNWSDNEKNFKNSTWQDWALIKIGLTVCLVFFICFIAFFLSLVFFFASSHSFDPPFRYSTELFRKHHIVNENVSVSEEVNHKNKRNADAEHQESQKTIESSILEKHHNKWNDNSDLAAESEEIKRCVLLKES